MRQLQGIDTAMLLQWAKQGKLPPVSGPGVDTYRRYLFHRKDVERLYSEYPSQSESGDENDS